MQAKEIPVVLTIAGSDSSGGAGVQADLKTFAANGSFGVSVITCLTAQNPQSVTSIVPASPSAIKEQLKQLIDYYPIKAIKTGMLYNAAIMREVATFLDHHTAIPTIIDPVMIASSGTPLINASAIDIYKNELFPQATLITPNLDECNALIGHSPQNTEEQSEAAKILFNRFNCPILLKGGHLKSKRLSDVIYDGAPTIIHAERIKHINTHGSGCTLASAIASQLAHGRTLKDAILAAHKYLQNCLKDPIHINGNAFINHFAGYSKQS